MTIEEKNEALCNAVNNAWDDAFFEWEPLKSEDEPNVFIMGEKKPGKGFIFLLAGCRDTYGGWIWIEYEPEKDLVGIHIKDRPIQSKFKEDIKTLFEKYSPFNMKVSYEGESTPVISRIEKVEPKDFLNFFEEFKRAYDEYYPLFYMFTVSAQQWYDGFYIDFCDC